ncbi:ankyrin repeat domain-containing protein [Streptomyces sp. NBC_00102]|uniref:ankyrin repeat domain-containing protein n=1 Tax=Streptomyces sp. NBC_00102 TaxID=2975652 RepID=UPI0022568C00|nr:ankyrin repeat domain-containing protein [Streptomyces sp. NBC_00102]MCX5400470.1 ankyrin repeat domain-containing protein [Streptomyces sp. NBC_00102]
MANPWAGLTLDDWTDLAEIEGRLESGADPRHPSLLHDAAEYGSPEVVALLAELVDDLDVTADAHTALFRAVHARRHDNARALAAAGADPWKRMLGNWSPARLSLAGPCPGLFGRRGGAPGLTPGEEAAVAESRLLCEALGEYIPYENTALAFVAGIDAAETARRLEAEPLGRAVAGNYEDWYEQDFGDEDMAIVGVTAVPGGCVVVQPWGLGVFTDSAQRRLSPGTVSCGYYSNPSGSGHGWLFRDGDSVSYGPPPTLFEITCGVGDDHWERADSPHAGEEGPGAGLRPAADAVLASYLYQGSVGYYCAVTGLRPADSRAFTDGPDGWFRLPEHLAL